MMTLSELIDLSDLPQLLPASNNRAASPLQPLHNTAQAAPASEETPGRSFEEVEKHLVVEALSQAEGNQSKAARQLKIGRDALRYKMKKYGLL
jgi:DNA-binding NtrC family response regulator